MRISGLPLQITELLRLAMAVTVDLIVNCIFYIINSVDESIWLSDWFRIGHSAAILLDVIV